MNVKMLLISALLFSGLASAAGPLASLVPQESTLAAANCSENGYGLETQSVGLRTVVCNLRNLIGVDVVESRIGVKMFQGGAGKDPFDFGNPRDFNRYNPEFFVKLRELHKTEYGETAISQAYDRYFKHIVRSYYVVGKAIRNNPGFRETQLAAYRAAISKGEPIDPSALFLCKNISVYYHGEFGTESTAYKQQGYSSNVAYFWFRREIDGSSDALFQLISQVVAMHDRSYYSQIEAKKPAFVKECDKEIWSAHPEVMYARVN